MPYTALPSTTFCFIGHDLSISRTWVGLWALFYELCSSYFGSSPKMEAASVSKMSVPIYQNITQIHSPKAHNMKRTANNMRVPIRTPFYVLHVNNMQEAAVLVCITANGRKWPFCVHDRCWCNAPSANRGGHRNLPFKFPSFNFWQVTFFNIKNTLNTLYDLFYCFIWLSEWIAMISLNFIGRSLSVETWCSLWGRNFSFKCYLHRARWGSLWPLGTALSAVDAQTVVLNL